MKGLLGTSVFIAQESGRPLDTDSLPDESYVSVITRAELPAGVLAQAQRRINVNDLWIAAIALAHGLAVVTQDADFDPLLDLGGPAVIRV